MSTMYTMYIHVHVRVSLYSSGEQVYTCRTLTVRQETANIAASKGVELFQPGSAQPSNYK